MACGTVVRVVDGKGFGFISQGIGRPDIFFHFSRLVGLDFDESLLERRVEFETEEGPDGRPRATSVRPA